MNIGWNISQTNFIEDDGSLPGIEFSDLSPESVLLLVRYFFSFGTIVTPNATVHDNLRQVDVPLDDADDPASLILSGSATSFHCCFAGLKWDAIDLPVLGLMVFSDSIEIDYRMGDEWTPEKVEAMFRFVSHLITLAPEGIVASTRSEGLPYPELFDCALDHYAPQRKRRSRTSRATQPLVAVLLRCFTVTTTSTP